MALPRDLANGSVADADDVMENFEYLEDLIQTEKEAVHPVGSLYINITGVNPNTELGFGTWVAFGAGKCLVGLDAGDADFDTVEETGGAKTHTLSTAEMPVHAHSSLYIKTLQTAGWSTAYAFGAASVPDSGFSSYIKTAEGGDSDEGAIRIEQQSKNGGNTGSGNAHNIMNPYIVVHFWKRTV